MILARAVTATLTAVELDINDELHLTLANGQRRQIRVCEAKASVYESNLDSLPQPGPLAKVVLRMFCRLEIDGRTVSINRWVGSDQSFYQPLEILGLRVWFDGCTMLFDHLRETHGSCKPRRHVRLAVQDASLRVCPVLLHPWCPLPPGGLKISDCYQGSDCWMGPYFGVDAHGGLDINHPAGTPLWTPIAIDQQHLFNSLSQGHENNRWRGVRRWADGAIWVLQAHHLVDLLVPEHTPLDAGTCFALSAGVHVGTHEHTHFKFGVIPSDAPPKAVEDVDAHAIWLDPWILFQQMYLDRQTTLAAGICGAGAK